MTTAISDGRRRVGRAEFTAVLAFSMALTALGIDLMLPAFAQIRADLGLPSDSTAVAGLITAYFLGLAVGQLGYGPLADRFGRRPILFVGYAVYGAAALVTALAPSLTWLLAGRVVWGLGAAAPRVVTLAMVRDVFEGEQMSRTMSLMMAVFILVPVVAPTLGAAVISVVSWRWLFGICAAVAGALAVWAGRLPETLRDEHRMQLRFGRIARAARVVVSNRQTVAYGLAMTALYGVFTSYLASAEIIFGETFGRADIFPYLFGGIAAAMGLAMLANAWIVERVGTRRLGHVVLLSYVVLAGGFMALAVATGGRPPLGAFVVGLAAMLSAHALLIPNLNTIAMDPMAAIAGTASSVIGAVQVAVGALLGAQLDRAFDGTVRPISYGFLGYGVVALALVSWARRGRLFRPSTPAPKGEPAPVAARR